MGTSGSGANRGEERVGNNKLGKTGAKREVENHKLGQQVWRRGKGEE